MITSCVESGITLHTWACSLHFKGRVEGGHEIRKWSYLGKCDNLECSCIVECDNIYGVSQKKFPLSTIAGDFIHGHPVYVSAAIEDT